MTAITLDQATAIIDAALAEARKRSLMPLTVVVLDAGGHIVAVKREDGSGILRVEIANGKAYSALGMGFGSRELFERAAKGPAFVSALAATSGGRMTPSPGGVLIVDAKDRTIGAVGISGDGADADEACAVAGIAAARLRGRVGAGPAEG